MFGDEALLIGLDQDVSSVNLDAINGAAEVCQRGDGTDDCIDPDFTMTPGTVWRLEKVPDSDPIRCRFVQPSSGTVLPEGDCHVDITWVDNADLADPSAANLVRINGERTYAHGSLHVRPNDPDPDLSNAFHIALSIGLEEYLRGIAVVWSGWPSTVLEVQATISRSYGVATATARAPSGTLSTYQLGTCWCHLHASTLDQNYVGWSKESDGDDAKWGKRWVAAVEATRGLVLIHSSTGNSIIKSFYSASTGGHTENNEDVWGGTPRAYLRSVDDHWALDPEIRNPFATWTVNVSQSAMLEAIGDGWDAVLSAKVVTGPPGVIVEFSGTRSGVAVMTRKNGHWFRREFGVRSPYVSAVLAPGTVPPFVDIADSIHYESMPSSGAKGSQRDATRPPTTGSVPTATSPAARWWRF